MASERNYLNERRLELHNKLVAILGTNQVYFQPPESVKINYPAIIYERYDIPAINADDLVYLTHAKYRVIYIDSLPNSIVVDKLSKFPTAKFNRHYVSENMNHDVFIIYF